MAELKTKKNDKDVRAFLEAVEHKKRKEDSLKLFEMMNEAIGTSPNMWGDSIVGYGSYHYKSKSGQEGDWFVTGFSPRKQSMTVYVLPGLDTFEAELAKLGKHKVGKGCIYINKLEDVNTDILMDIVKKAFLNMEGKNFKVEV